MIGLIFSGIYFFVFRFLILKFDIPLPGRRAEEEVKLFSKKIKREKGEGNTDNSGFTPSNEYEAKAYYYLEGLGGKENIKDVTNCTTRLRLTVNDESKVEDSGYFTHDQMAHGLVKRQKCPSCCGYDRTSSTRSI